MVSLSPRSDVYHFLAESLSEPPDWMALAGRDWPIYEAALDLALESEAARTAVLRMIEIGEEPIEARRERYANLFSDRGRPQVWIYESGALSGRLSTEVTWDVEQWYRLAGIDILGAELPDHASLELEFLAYLEGAEEIDFSRVENRFFRSHAGRWLPDLGRALQMSGDPVYAPIGQFLRNWLEEANPGLPDAGRPAAKNRKLPKQFPVLQPGREEDCTLCGFCVQRCPFKALKIREDHQTTALQMSPKNCLGCAKCVRVCESNVLGMEDATVEENGDPSGWQTLRQSPRITCQGCGAPMVSQAEYQYVSARLGHPAWLKLCQDCRPGYTGRE